MYDFRFGEKKEILRRPEDFLIFVKRLLPRWVNGIPDSECIAIFKALSLIEEDRKNKSKIYIETGCGASTLALFLGAVINNGHVYSWDTNGMKGSFLRKVILESMCYPLGINLFDYWTFVGFDSTNRLIGIPVLSELNKKACFGYFDSWHTLVHLQNELRCFESVAEDKFIIALDDAYYRKREENYSYINMIRKKMSLKAVEESEENKCEPFYLEIENYLKKNYRTVNKIDDYYKTHYENDIFFEYYSSDRKAMNEVGMEERESLAHRFDAWRVSR